jgi:hypothetical protein
VGDRARVALPSQRVARRVTKQADDRCTADQLWSGKPCDRTMGIVPCLNSRQPCCIQRKQPEPAARSILGRDLQLCARQAAMIHHLRSAIAFRAAKALPALSRSGSRGRSRLRRDRGRRPILATRSPSHRRTRVAVGAIAGGLIVPGFVRIQQKENNCRGDHRHNYRKTSAASPAAGPQFLVSVKIGHRVHPSVGPSHVTPRCDLQLVSSRCDA